MNETLNTQLNTQLSELSELDSFVNKYSGYTESYWFYNNTVELRYEPKNHIYYRVMDNGELVAQAGVTSVCGIIDKSNQLIPWACQQMAQEILDVIPTDYPANCPWQKCIEPLRWEGFESLVLAAKSAHKKKLDQASFVGNLAHDWIEAYIKAILAGHIVHGVTYWALPPPNNEQAANCCKAALSWMTRHNIRWIHTEKKVYSLQFGFAGTMDGLCLADSCTDTQCCRYEFKDQLCLADWKSSNELRIEYLLQTAAYQFAYQEEHGQMIYSRWVIRLGKEDGEFEPWHINTLSEDWNAFRHALDLNAAVHSIKKRMKDHEAILRSERKAEKKKAREEAFAIKCKGADKYKGIRKPACNGGVPCQTCTTKYDQLHPNKG